jgi:hypothetical protein
VEKLYNKRSGIFDKVCSYWQKCSTNMQTGRFVVRQIFTPNRASKPILRSFCKLGNSIVRKWHN